MTRPSTIRSLFSLERHFITYKNSKVHYCKFGSGCRLLFCFHGYGEEGNTFYPLEKRMGKDYTLIAVDLPFHGATLWHDGLLFTPQDLLEVLALITQEPGKPFNLLGYSMGGRVASPAPNCS
jgi:pimeloyl-ACP methyl ester carboxylesterase